ncbi:thioredoxin-like protein [Patellaria atrata CBS 101060]|uniref:Thioredoxin-like protein n=1 Tax=Patellaria atrata CBS 101060 TaxID=1346257 RepID=A0A9P4VTX7_9PEZI|nr:thioredoxin-like protein [Patellaria atrata CBS 101060]
MSTTVTETSPKITLYADRQCPYAHRVYITLKELDLPFEEVTVPLAKPREEWYLKMNPRGQVPTLKYTAGNVKDEILVESAIISRFLADTKPSAILPASNSGPEAALTRARYDFFISVFEGKLLKLWYQLLFSKDEEKEPLAKEFFKVAEEDLESLLKDSNPFFGGSTELTFVETQVAPFVLRIAVTAKHGLIPSSTHDSISTLPNFSKWRDAILEKEIVRYVFDEDQYIGRLTSIVEAKKSSG